MAHTVFLTRGHIDHIEPFMRELSSRYLPMKIYNQETKKLEDKMVQMRLCPVQLWDLSYPKQHRDAIHTTLFPGGKGEGFSNPRSFDKIIWGIRKALKLQDIPDFKRDSWLAMRPLEHTEVIAIGCKDDYWMEPDGTHSDEKNKSEFAYEGI